MQATSMQLEKRIARLEKNNRRLALFAFSAVGLLLVGAAKTPAAVSATSFQLLDEGGQVRAELATREGAPGLFLKDKDGIDRVALFHEPDSSGMHVMDADGVTRIGAVQFSHGGGGFALHGPESKGAAVLYLKGEGSLRFFDAKGNVTNGVPANSSEP